MASPQQYSTNLGLSVLPEIDERKNQDVYNQFLYTNNAIRVLQAALDNYTGAGTVDSSIWSQIPPSQSFRLQDISRVYILAAEDIPLAYTVTFNPTGPNCTAYKASAVDATRPARAFCSKDVSAGAIGEFVLLGINPFISGLGLATTYYLSATTPGVITPTPPATSGNIVQPIGYSLDSSTLYFNPSSIWTVVP